MIWTKKLLHGELHIQQKSRPVLGSVLLPYMTVRKVTARTATACDDPHAFKGSVHEAQGIEIKALTIKMGNYI